MHWRFAALRALTALACTAAVTGCGGGPEVVRVASGRDASGRWIHPDAYAAYLDGAIAESRGDSAAAEVAYQAAIAEDPSAAEAWARLGALRCLTARAEADRALARARALAVDLEDGWLAAATCALRRGDARAAVANAERALALGPTDPEASHVLSDALDRAGQSERARRILHALGLRTRLASSETTLASIDRALGVERALARGDVTGARAAGRIARLSDADVALRAVSMGRPDLAGAVAARALVSDPGDSSSLVLALTSADLEHQDETLGHLARPLPTDRVRPSPEAAALMEQLLARRAGQAAATAWANARGPSGPAPSARAAPPAPAHGPEPPSP